MASAAAWKVVRRVNDSLRRGLAVATEAAAGGAARAWAQSCGRVR